MKTPNMEERVNAYLKDDRQWLRHIRIAHAKAKLSRAETLEEKEFWQHVLKANSRTGDGNG